ncbi:MAG: DUF4132 domain-containing protein [Planctomycetes bacterium]|nr:DUF4132 domain-containing protein [Planctomycetota bacterium]
MIQWLKDLAEGKSVKNTLIAPDNFPLPANSELSNEHKTVSDVLSKVVAGKQTKFHRLPARIDVCREALDNCQDFTHDRLFLAWVERGIAHELELTATTSDEMADVNLFFHSNVCFELFKQLMQKGTPESVRPALTWLCVLRHSVQGRDQVVKRLIWLYEKKPPNNEELQHLILLHSNIINSDDYYNFGNSLSKLVPADLTTVLDRYDVWAEQAIADICRLKKRAKENWLQLLLHFKKAKSASPTNTWTSKTDTLLSKIDADEFRSLSINWLGMACLKRVRKAPKKYYEDVDESWLIHSSNADVLRGIIWALVPYSNPEVNIAIRDLAISCYKKISGIGPRSVKVGNACVSYFGRVGTVETVAQLAILKIKVKFKTAQKLIEKALVATAEKAGVPRDELEEMAVPEYGLTEVGKRIEQFGEFRCEQVIKNGKVELRWFKPDGKQQKSVPAFVKENHAEDLKEIKDAAKDIQKLLPAQSVRIEGNYLTEKVWDYEIWAERYLNHPLVATVARRLIWQIDNRSVIPTDGLLRDAKGKEVKAKKKSKVKLWHPLFVDDAEVQAWRGHLFDNQIKQPFKQAYREIYRLTDAEVNTGNYSNRFAAHIIKQHQFNALVAARGWSHTLRMMVDAEYEPAHINLPHWNLRAEYWVEGIGDEYGQDTTEIGVYLRLVTDQVRFYRTDAGVNWAHAGGGGYSLHGEEAAANEPLPLSEIPELLFSEIFRDVDLFVGVSSVGADPQWADGGAEGRFVEYWQNYSFGDLSETAKTRRELLERLIPMLKIADKCELTDKWLKVTGSIRTYKIHLGSGNILMEPNDEYLCIVANASMGKAADKVFLPFEGDRTMAVILSKAFLLADDKKIKDKTILSQIKRGQ